MGGEGEGRRGTSLPVPSCTQYPGYAGVPIAGHALWAEVGDGSIVIAFWECTGFPVNAFVNVRVVTMEVSVVCGSTVFTVGYCHKCSPQRVCPVSMVIMHER